MIVDWTEDVIFLSGDLTQDHWKTIRTAVALVLKRHPAGVIIDLSQIERITPEGTETFLHMLRYIESGEARFILANAPDHVRQALSKVPGVRSQLPVSSSIEEARASLNLLSEVEPKRKELVEPVLVSLSGDHADQDGLTLAAAIARSRNTGIVAVYLIEVPRALALTAPMPDEEAVARKTLTSVAEQCKHLGVEARCIPKRVRERLQGLESMATEVDAQIIFVVLGSQEVDSEQGAALDSLLQATRREVIVYRGPAGET
ncbi:MAG: STAS domain-containing protein [Fimbriimonadia bacterium]|jgi:ABC-type transporter Mla MlaB component